MRNTSTDYELKSVSSVDLTLTEAPWPFAQKHSAEIECHWASCIEQNPKLFNGNILLMVSGGLVDGDFTAELVEVDYASFLTWRDWGWSDKSVHDCYGSAMVVSSDGAIILGRMGVHTLNAGLLYPPGGSLTCEDRFENGKVDLPGSIARELEEETGLLASNAESGGFYMAASDQRIAIGQILRFPETATQLVEKIERFLASETEPELAGIVALRDPAGIDPSIMPPHGRAFSSVVLEGAPFAS